MIIVIDSCFVVVYRYIPQNFLLGAPDITKSSV